MNLDVLRWQLRVHAANGKRSLVISVDDLQALLDALDKEKEKNLILEGLGITLK